MTILNAFALLAAMAPGSEVKTPQIMQAALYKNGYSAIIRKVELDADGDTMIGGITPSVMGTFWVYGSPGLRIDSLINTMVTDKAEIVANSIPEILRLNKGATVTLQLKDAAFTGKLVDVTNVAILQVGDGTMVVNLADIVRISIQGPAKLNTETTTSTGGLRVNANGPGTLYLLSVESGLDWDPQYWFDILDDSRLKITMRTSVSNDIGPLKDAELSFVAGSPNLPMIGSYDPFTLFTTGFRRDSGGFGGGGTGAPGRPSQMQNVAPTAGASFEMADAFNPGDASGESLGELFYYRRQKVNLVKAEKGYYVLFEAATTYSTLYSIDFSADEIDDSPLATWQTIKFRNSSGVPLTTAPATAYRENKLIGQDNLKYTPAGAEGSLRLARAVDITSRFNSTEASDGTLVIDRTTHQVVLRSGTVTLQNLKKEDALIEVQTTTAGEVVSADNGGEFKRLAERVNDLNPMSRIKWTLRLKPNEKRQLKFTYRRVL